MHIFFLLCSLTMDELHNRNASVVSCISIHNYLLPGVVQSQPPKELTTVAPRYNEDPVITNNI